MQIVIISQNDRSNSIVTQSDSKSKMLVTEMLEFPFC